MNEGDFCKIMKKLIFNKDLHIYTFTILFLYYLSIYTQDAFPCSVIRFNLEMLNKIFEIFLH